MVMEWTPATIGLGDHLLTALLDWALAASLVLLHVVTVSAEYEVPSKARVVDRTVSCVPACANWVGVRNAAIDSKYLSSSQDVGFVSFGERADVKLNAALLARSDYSGTSLWLRWDSQFRDVGSCQNEMRGHRTTNANGRDMPNVLQPNRYDKFAVSLEHQILNFRDNDPRALREIIRSSGFIERSLIQPGHFPVGSLRLFEGPVGDVQGLFRGLTGFLVGPCGLFESFRSQFDGLPSIVQAEHSRIPLVVRDCGIDDRRQRDYSSEEKLQAPIHTPWGTRLGLVMLALALFTSCLGLWGLCEARYRLGIGGAILMIVLAHIALGVLMFSDPWILLARLARRCRASSSRPPGLVSLYVFLNLLARHRDDPAEQSLEPPVFFRFLRRRESLLLSHDPSPKPSPAASCR